jgi:glutamyl-tRNA(Gln) amidotransferase subunit E
LILASPQEKIHTVVDQIILRIEYIRDNGIPKDTRLATQTGETKFLRPRPGAARMYPETDIPPIIISKKELAEAENNIPKSWDDSIKELESKYKINPQLAEQVFDSRYIGLFEKIVKDINTNPTFVASVLCSSITNLERSGLDSNLLKNEEIFKSFQLLEDGKITKESVEIVFENIMAGKSKTIEEAMKNTSIQSVNEDDLERIIDDIVEKNEEIIKNQKERAIGPLMGIAMKELRGKVSGETINNLLLQNIKKKIENKLVREVGFEPTNS